jgi:hypothetical protein
MMISGRLSVGRSLHSPLAEPSAPVRSYPGTFDPFAVELHQQQLGTLTAPLPSREKVEIAIWIPQRRWGSESPVADAVMTVEDGFFNDAGSILVNQYLPYGNLLGLVNHYRLKV